MSSNLPPGVTGTEDHFGPRWESDGTTYCHVCGKDTDHLWQYWNNGVDRTCLDCDAVVDATPDPAFEDPEPNEDHITDSWL